MELLRTKLSSDTSLTNLSTDLAACLADLDKSYKRAAEENHACCRKSPPNKHKSWAGICQQDSLKHKKRNSGNEQNSPDHNSSDGALRGSRNFQDEVFSGTS
jgi:hypothetical protein